jgi:hypothetical protein
MRKVASLASCTPGWLTLLTRIGAWVLAGAVTAHWNEPLLGALFAICVPSHSSCHATGLHWRQRDGKTELRLQPEEGTA